MQKTDTDTATDTAPPRRTAAEWTGLTALALLVMTTGALVGLLGPVLAIACDTCQDGVRTPHFTEALIAVAQYGVPLTTLGTVFGIFHPRGGARVGATGLGVLVLLLIAVAALGQ
jgi:hypothetical protein